MVSDELQAKINELLTAMDKGQQLFAPDIAGVSPVHTAGARNLADYLAARSLDLTHLQAKLHQLGLSSLGNAESHIRQQVGRVKAWLNGVQPDGSGPDGFFEGKKELNDNAIALLGLRKMPEVPVLMVTLEEKTGGYRRRLENLLKAGMSIARINCAHDDEKTWLDIIENLHAASLATGLSCRIFMDMPGPKLRVQLSKKTEKLTLRPGDRLTLLEKFEASSFSADSPIVQLEQPGVIAGLKPGERVIFDDGVISGQVEQIVDRQALIVITNAENGKAKLKPGKGISFPDSNLTLPVFSERDLQCLEFICAHSDMVGFSFVSTGEEVSELQQYIDKTGPGRPAIVVKLERTAAIDNLASILFHGMQSARFGVMIARGDLAVEAGYSRTSELQEEIMWFCEAARLPVIWATQVMESLNKTGVPTRGEVSDAALGAQAECIMINKGKQLDEVLKLLTNVSIRSNRHHLKKRFVLPPLPMAIKSFIGKSGSN